MADIGIDATAAILFLTPPKEPRKMPAQQSVWVTSKRSVEGAIRLVCMRSARSRRSLLPKG